jgi:hypothetical protein
MRGDAYGRVVETGVEDVRPVTGRGHPCADHRPGRGQPQRAPTDVLPDFVADPRVEDVSRRAHAPEQRVPASAGVIEVVAKCHVPRVALGGPLQASVERQRPLACNHPLPVDQAQGGGAHTAKVMRRGAKFGAGTGAEAANVPVAPGVVTCGSVPMGQVAGAKGAHVAPMDVASCALALGAGDRFSMRARRPCCPRGSGQGGEQSQRQRCEQPFERHDRNRSYAARRNVECPQEPRCSCPEGRWQAGHATAPGGGATLPSLPIFGDGPHPRSAPDACPRARGWPGPWASACRSQSTRRTYQIDGRCWRFVLETPRSLRVSVYTGEQVPPKCRQGSGEEAWR